MSLAPSPLKPNLGESSTLPKPTPHTGMKKLRKKKRTNNMNRALDEHDDVDESDLMAGPAKRRRIGVDDDDVSENDDDEDEDGEDGDGVEGVQESERLLGQDGSDKLEKRNTRRRKQAYYLREMCDTDQGKRYDAFVVTSIPKAAVTKLNRDLFEQPVKDDFASIIGSLGKIFVAEVVELAKDIQEERGETGALTPDHLRLAKERMEENGLKGKKGMFRR